LKNRLPVFVLSSTLIGVTIGVSPAQAIFGLSKCEKVKSYIVEENKVHNNLAKTFNRTLSDAKKKEPRATYLQAIQLSYFESFLNIFNAVDKNPKCFTLEAVADTRTAIEIMKKNIKNAKEWDGVTGLDAIKKATTYDYASYYFGQR